jgi:D-3-phosphoglycerate dehydrogenase
VFDSAEKLKLIVCCRGGVKSVVDLEEAKRRGILVCNNRGRNAGALSDLVMGFILDMTRCITKTNVLVHAKRLTGVASSKPKEYRDVVWGLDNNSPFIKYRGRSINHMTIGILGYGHTGRAVAQKANLFGMRVIAHSPHFTAANAPNTVQPVSFDELLAQSDVVSVNCSVTDATRDLFSRPVFERMKDGSYFINTARGEIVVEEDLVWALKTGKLAGAAIDVTRQEPIPEDSPLVGAPNLIITPHIAGSADDVQSCGTQMVIESLLAYLDGVKPPYSV